MNWFFSGDLDIEPLDRANCNGYQHGQERECDACHFDPTEHCAV